LAGARDRFASGATLSELWQALSEAISLYLSEPGQEVHIELDEDSSQWSVTVESVLARSA